MNDFAEYKKMLSEIGQKPAYMFTVEELSFILKHTSNLDNVANVLTREEIFDELRRLAGKEK